MRVRREEENLYTSVCARARVCVSSSDRLRLLSIDPRGILPLIIDVDERQVPARANVALPTSEGEVDWQSHVSYVEMGALE